MEPGRNRHYLSVHVTVAWIVPRYGRWGTRVVSLICAVGVTDGLGGGMVDGNSLFDPVGKEEGTCSGDSDGGPMRRGSIHVAFAIRSPGVARITTVSPQSRTSDLRTCIPVFQEFKNGFSIYLIAISYVAGTSQWRRSSTMKVL